MYGLILAKDQNYREAEIFLKSVTDIYPRSVEGWVILHLLYICMDYHPGITDILYKSIYVYEKYRIFFYFFFAGIDLTLRTAEKCIKDDDPDIEISKEDSLTWTTIHCSRDNVYMITTILLLKLHFCDVINFSLKNLYKIYKLLSYFVSVQFASIALTEEISRSDKSIYGLYYLAVQHYLLNQYEDALSHLKEAESIYGLVCFIAFFLSHSFIDFVSFNIF